MREQGKEAVKAEMYREALKQTPNGFYRRQLYVLEVNLRQQQAMWVDLHHSIFYEVSCLHCNVMKPAVSAAPDQELICLYVMHQHCPGMCMNDCMELKAAMLYEM